MRMKRTLQPNVAEDKIVFGYGNESLVRSLPYTKKNEELVKKLDRYDTNDIDKYTLDELNTVKKWAKKGLLTNNQYNDDKYSRNINFFEWIDISENTDPVKYQQQLSQKEVLIVGMGGIGGNIAEILTRLGVKRFILLDFDKVDASNLTRQSVFQEKDIGYSKVLTVKRYLKEIDSSVGVITIEKKITTKQDLDEVYKQYDFDLALCCADKPEIVIDYWFDDLSEKYGKPFIAGSYASTVINYTCIRPGKTESLRKFYSENMITDENLLENKAPTSIIAPISYMAAGLIAYRAFYELVDLRNEIPDAIQIDLLNWQVMCYDLNE